MLACVFGQVGKQATSANSKREKYGARVTWELFGRTASKSGKKYCKAARARLLNENAQRVFQVGDCVLVSGQGQGDDTEKWAGQVISFFEVLTDSGTEGKDASCYRVVLRWLYRPKDVMDKELELAEEYIKTPLHYEMFMSDAIETEGCPIECIIGRCYVRPTVKSIKSAKASPPSGYWKEVDEFILVRSFYGSSEHYPRPLRKLEVGELAYLCRNPTSADQYNESLLFRRHGHKVMDVDDDDSQASKNIRPDNSGSGISSSSAPRKKPKRENMEIRPMYRCPCCTLDPDTSLTKKRKHNDLGEVEPSTPIKRPRRQGDENDTCSRMPVAAEIDEPSEIVQNAVVENPARLFEKEVCGTMTAGKSTTKVEDEEEDLEELEFSPPKSADLNVTSENTTAVTGQETSEETQRLESMSIEHQLEFERKKEA